MSNLNFLKLFAMFCLPVAAFASHAATAERDTVLIVVSGEGRDQGKTRPGYEFDELSQAWLIFRDNGLNVEVASPQGGAVEADRYNAKEPFNAELLADSAAMRALANTRTTRELKAEDYAAVYVVGGKGAMFDLPKDNSLRQILADVYENGGIVAAVCHGPAALADVRLRDGSLLVAGKSLTGFSNEEETVFGKKWAKEFPWLLEDALRTRGANWQEAALMMPNLVVDGRLITGQNPYSTTAVAEAIVRGLRRTPVDRERWRDEVTMDLVMQFLSGDASGASAEVKANKARYHIDLIGLLGYYQLKAATSLEHIRDAVAIMELAAPYMDQPQLAVGIAKGHSRMGDTTKARDMLRTLLAKTPNMPEAKALLDQLGG